MIRDRNIAPDAGINPTKFLGGYAGMGGLLPAAKTYFVDRNAQGSGDGSSLEQAFMTIGEAVTKVNADYALGTGDLLSRGRMRRIMVAEGWYSETPLRLTASDVHILGIAPGAHDPVVLYGSATAGGWDIGAGGPALTLEGSNCTIENMGFFTYDTSYYCLQDGRHKNDALGRKAVYGNKIVNCGFVRDQFQASKGGILSYNLDTIWIEGCFFSTSALSHGVAINTDGENNPVNPTILGCRFIGCDTGIYSDANGVSGWVIMNNVFLDDNTDRANASDNPLNITGYGIAAFNFAPHNTEAEFNAGGTLHELFNYHSELTFFT